MQELISEFTTRGHTAGFMSCMIAILYFLTIYGLETIGTSTIWRPAFRGFLADYAYVVCVEPEYARLAFNVTHTCHRSGQSSGWDSHTFLVRSRQRISRVSLSVEPFIQRSREVGSFNFGNWTPNGSSPRCHLGFWSCCSSTMITYETLFKKVTS